MGNTGDPEKKKMKTKILKQSLGQREQLQLTSFE